MFRPGPAKTTGGFQVTILTTGARGPYSIVGLIHSKNESVDDPHSWTSRGKYHKDKDSQTMDLRQDVCGD